MSGKPGTPHFGVNKDVQSEEYTTLQDNGKHFDKIHFEFDPAQKSRAMGSTVGDAPGCGWEKHDRQRDYCCNHDGYSGGNSHNLNMDEQKVLQNTIYSQKIEYADDLQHNWGSEERSA